MIAGIRRISEFASKNTLLILLILAAIIGTIYVFIIPPWEHYDEPGHFEYAWLAANRSEWPKWGDYDQSMRREVGASMLEHNFHEYSIYHLLKTDEPISIIIPQTGDVPLYYFLASLPLRLIKHSDITFQLYIARFLSLGLLLTTIFLAYQCACLIFGKKHPLAWMTPLFLVLLPGFVEIMTAVNNDAAAISCLTFFLYAGTLLFLKGFSFKRIILLAVSVVLCLFAKSTAFLALPLCVVVIILTFFKKLRFAKVIGLVAACGLVITPIIFSLQKTAPAFFYAQMDPSLPITIDKEEAPLGNHVIAQESGGKSGKQYFLPFLSKEISTYKNPALTFGAWIWADTTAAIQSPEIYCRNFERAVPFTNEAITITSAPTYYSFSISLAETLNSICWVSFYTNTNLDNNIYWDGILLVEGSYGDSTIPEYLDDQAEVIVWNGTTIENIIKNGSGEKAWPTSSSIIQNAVLNRVIFSISNVFSILDLAHFQWYFQYVLAHIFRSFWGQFGWGSIHYLGAHPYRFFLALSFVGGVGAIFIFRRKPTTGQQKVFLLFFTVFILQSVMVIFRGVGTWYDRLFFPSARYLYPAVLPIGLFLTLGYYEIIDLLNRRLKLPRVLLSGFYICVLMGVMCWAILSILKFTY